MLAVEVLGWVGSALLVYSLLQTRILRLRLVNGVASALLVIFNAAIAVWPTVGLNVTLTAINVFSMVRLLRGRHDSRTFEVVEISPNVAYLKHLLHEFDADIQHYNPGFSCDDAARAEFGFLILTGAERVGLVLARNAGDGSAQVDLDEHQDTTALGGSAGGHPGVPTLSFIDPPAAQARSCIDEEHPSAQRGRRPGRHGFGRSTVHG